MISGIWRPDPYGFPNYVIIIGYPEIGAKER